MDQNMGSLRHCCGCIDDDEIENINKQGRICGIGFINFISKIRALFRNNKARPLATEEPETVPVEDVEDDYDNTCPTCFEEYSPENPKMITKCAHHYHLGCIYEWMERSSLCPICQRVMDFEEST